MKIQTLVTIEIKRKIEMAGSGHFPIVETKSDTFTGSVDQCNHHILMEVLQRGGFELNIISTLTKIV